MMTQYSDITRFFAIFILLILIGCESGSVERQQNGDVRFKTTAPSLIYFKNIKSLKYQINRDPQSQMDFYRPKAFMKATNLPIIYPVIVQNWLEDESYLVFEKKNIADSAKILVKGKNGNSIELNWPSEDYVEQLAFIRKLEGLLKSNQNIEIKVAEGEVKSLDYSIPERTSFLIVIQDFLNLTETASSRAKK